MTREGYLKHNDKDYFRHWGNGGQVQMEDHLLKGIWYDDDNPTWSANRNYRIKPQNKWEGTQVYEHWQNGGKVEMYVKFDELWRLCNIPSWYDNFDYRIPPNHWIRTEPPKDRWILRQLYYNIELIVCVKLDSEPINSNFNNWEGGLKRFFEKDFIPNKWAEIPKE